MQENKYKNSKATIIVNTYNRSKILAERSLPSALNQTYKNFDVIIVDDCSKDDTEEIVKEFQKKYSDLRYIKQKGNKGLAASRNTGARKARGEYVVCLDDDDALDQKFLEITVPVLDRLPKDFGGVGCGRKIIYPEAEIYSPPAHANQLYISIDDGFLLRKSIFSKINYDENLRWSEDADFGIQFFKNFKIHMIDKPLLLKYGHKIEASKKTDYFSFSFPSEQVLVDMQKYIDKNLPFFYERRDKKEIAYIYRMAGRNYCWGGHMFKGISFLWRACVTRPVPRNILNLLMALCGPFIYRYYLAFETRMIRLIRSRL
ncbi:MAG: Glycosyl transferase [Candidatus Jorgensenbacteria bacterium GW2011_GWC1_48_8]|uniref:Glycosyl transferase n=1 Tax=Candidatus Jorgensenbacteria bacterium GW2011_GWC1_48_8 TaxID=1618666 RepID=A0A0G1UWY8_9BACT|nr:MAG: Glycosyl transferase [Parcubacteria group bacterium GW2011_GWB1_45_10]KKU98754.1 MAG: Glycosyl transferase [Candidatus Jorgensenbacteria bacterium GW2011_GWC1_48_8]